MLKFAKSPKGWLLWTEEDESGLKGYIEHYHVNQGHWAVGLQSHEPTYAQQLIVREGSAAGTLDAVVNRYNVTEEITLPRSSQLAIVQAIQAFKALAFNKLAGGIGQATVDLS